MPRPRDDDQVCVLETNLDDISGELIGYCTARLWEAGALDVYTTAIQMKKNRPGVKLTVLCRPADAAAVEDVLFSETTTLGVRRWTAARHGAAPAAAHGGRRLGAGRRQDRLAPRRPAPFRPRVRVLPPHRRGPPGAAAGSLRSGPKGV